MQITSKSPGETKRIGRLLARHLQPDDIICLFGELGSGKTVLVKGIAGALNIGGEKVISPTFVLIREHKGRLSLFHFDLYRLKDPCEISALGYEEYLYADGVSVIEWADRLRELMPKGFLKIEISVLPGTQRKISFSAFGARHKELLRKINEPRHFRKVKKGGDKQNI